MGSISFGGGVCECDLGGRDSGILHNPQSSGVSLGIGVDTNVVLLGYESLHCPSGCPEVDLSPSPPDLLVGVDVLIRVGVRGCGISCITELGLGSSGLTLGVEVGPLPLSLLVSIQSTTAGSLDKGMPSFTVVVQGSSQCVECTIT